MARRTGDARPVGERLDAYFDVGEVLTGRNGSSPKGETKTLWPSTNSLFVNRSAGPGKDESL